MKLSLIPLIFASCLASGTDFIAPSEIVLKSTHTLSLLGQSETIELTHEEISVISILLRRRTRLSDNAIKTSLERMFIKAGDVGTLVESINRKALAVFGRELIESSAYGYSFNRTPPDFHSILFAIPPNGLGVIYRGHLIPFSPRQTSFIARAAESPDRLIPYADIIDLTDSTNFRIARRTQEFIDGINRKSLEVTGAQLVELARGEGAQLVLHEMEPLPPSVAVETDRGLLTLTGNAHKIFSALRLWEVPYPSRLVLNQDDFARAGLPLQDFMEGVVQINGEFMRVYRSKLVSSVYLSMLGRSRRFTFFENTYSPRQLRGAGVPTPNCDSLLTTMGGRGVGRPMNWGLK